MMTLLNTLKVYKEPLKPFKNRLKRAFYPKIRWTEYTKNCFYSDPRSR
jgi:hypothetical protein